MITYNRLKVKDRFFKRVKESVPLINNYLSIIALHIPPNIQDRGRFSVLPHNICVNQTENRPLSFIIHSPYYILLFTFLLGYVYIIPVIDLNTSYYSRYVYCYYSFERI